MTIGYVKRFIITATAIFQHPLSFGSSVDWRFASAAIYKWICYGARAAVSEIDEKKQVYFHDDTRPFTSFTSKQSPLWHDIFN